MRLMGRAGLMMVAAGALVVLGQACVSTQTVRTVETPTAFGTNATSYVTNTVYELDPKAGGAIGALAELGTVAALNEDPNSGPYLGLVSQAFAGFANDGVTDPKVIQTALDNISIRELRDNLLAKKVVSAAFLAYKGLAAEAVQNKVEASKWGPFAQGVLRGIAEGITGGLAGS